MAGSDEHHIDLSAYPMEPQSSSPLGSHTNVYPEVMEPPPCDLLVCLC